MLKPVADGVLIHESEFCRSNAVVVQGRDGVLLVDAGPSAAFGDWLPAVHDGQRQRLAARQA